MPRRTASKPYILPPAPHPQHPTPGPNQKPQIPHHTHTHSNLAQDSNGVAQWRVPKKKKIQINMAIFVLKPDGRQQRRSSLESSLDPTTSGPLRTPANFRVPANTGPGKRGGN
jgi:hypothetical protein